MNRIFRLVFNHALGLWQVVSELVKSRRVGAKRGGGAVVGTLPPLRFAMYVALGFVTTVPAFAQAVQGDSQGRILVDRTAPGNQRPTVIQAPNGAPVVNIQTPSAAGVSRNSYSQFDVGNQGVVLNNSRSNTDTQLGGGIAGNPWLARGTAKVILNEVNGPASQLNGYVEVGGDRAQVIIANPTGIQVNGGGFLNASRATLTTGRPIFTGGNLDGYRVEGGAIRIDGAGLDATQTDYTDLIARSLELNAGVWAKQLQATLGAIIVSADHAQVATIAGTTAAPQFALDVSVLGGMYANKIHLIGNEHGVGVRNAGQIGATADDLTVTVDGRIENTGTLQARRDAHLDARGGVANAGTISASRELVIDTPADLDNSGGTLNARRIEVNSTALRNRGGSIEQTGLQALALNGESVSNRDGGRIGLAAPVAGGDGGGGSTGGSPGGSPGGATGGGDGGSGGGGSTGGAVLPDPTPLADGVLHIAGALDNDGGKINAGGGVGLNTATGINNDGGHLGLGELSITRGDLSNAGGELIVSGDASVHAQRIINDAGRLEIAGAMDLAAQSLSNRGGALVHGGTDDASIAVAGTFDNTDGTLASNAASLAINADALVNERGTIQHAGAGGLTLQIGNAQANASARPTLPADGDAVVAGANVWQPGTPPPTGALLGAGGRIVTAGALTLDANEVDHRDATLSAGQLAVTANAFDNSGGQVIASGEAANALQVFGILDNTGGTVASNADLGLRAGWLDNTDGTLQHAGTGTFTLDATRLYGSGGTLVSNGALAISGRSIGLDGGTTQARHIGISAGAVSNRGGSLIAFGADALTLTARTALDNTAGTIASNGGLALQAGSLVNANGTISASGTTASALNVDGTIDNTRGTVATAGALGIKAATLINRDTRGNEGEPAATGLQATALNVEATRVDNSNGQIGASGSVRLKAGSLSNTDGAITAGNALVIDATQLQGQGGTLGANGALTLTGTTLDLRDGTTFAQAIAIDSDRLTTAGGTLTAAGTEALRITARDTLDNTGGTVQGNGALHVAAGTLINRDTRAADGAPAKGLLSAGAMTLDSRRIDNTAGLLATGAAATVTTTDLINQNGAVQAGQGLAITASGLLDNRSGLIAGTDDTTLTAATLDNREGAIQHAGNGALAISATSLNGTGGTIASNGALRLTGTTTNLREATTFAQSIAIDTTDLTTAAGTLTAAGTGALSLTARGTLDNTAGTIQTNGALNLQAGAVTNRDGTVTAAGSGATQLRIVNAFDNSGGTLATAGATTVHAGAITNAAGTIQSGSDQTLTLTSDGRLANDGGTIAGNGAIDLTAASMTNANGTVQSQHAITAKVTGTLDNTAGTIASGDALTLSAGRLTNRDTFDPNAQPDAAAKGLFGRTVALDAAMIDNTRGQIQSSQSLSVRGGELDNAGGAIGGSGTVTLTLASLDNTGGQLLQYAQDGALAITTTGALTNAAGQIGSLGTASLRSGSVDNRGGTAFGWHGLSVQTDGDLINRDGGFLSAGRSDDAATEADETILAALDVRTGGVLDNAAGALDATGNLTVAADSLANAAGQILAGTADDAESALTVAVTNTLDNRGGTLASRGGDVQLTMRTLDNTTAGRVVTTRDLGLTANAVNNDAGTVFAQRNLRFANAAGTLDNGSGQFGAGETATVSLANVNNAVGGRLQANTLWLTTPNLSTDGEIVGNTVHAQLANLSGTGRLYGAEELDAKFSGDYTYGSGPRLESDVKLGLNVAGTFTNRGTLQTPGELALSATNVINAGTINASNADGSGHATITATGSITNQRGGSLEGDLLDLKAEAVDNTGDIVGDAVYINADTLTNGKPGTSTLASGGAYAEGYIGAAEYLALEVGQLSNLDANIYSGGGLDISGRGGTGTRAATVENLSGRIQAEGDATIAAEEILNARRAIGTEAYALSAEEQFALDSERRYDNALTADELARLNALNGRNSGTLTAAELLEQRALMGKIGWVHTNDVSAELKGALDAVYNARAISQGNRFAEYVGPVTADVKQFDTYLTGQRLDRTTTSAESQIVSGGDMTLDTGRRLRNQASRIAAGGNLRITGNADVENVAVAGQYVGTRKVTAWTREGSPGRFTNSSGSWRTNPSVREAASITQEMHFDGPALADATITANGGVLIEAGSVINTAVTAGGGIGVIGGGDVRAGASTGTGSAASASTAAVDGPGAAHGGTVDGSAGPGAAQGGAVTNQTGPAGAASQTVGTPERPLPGLVPPDNGRFKTNTDPNSPYLVTTAPRFAKGDSTGSDYLIALLGVSTDLHKRLGDGYYEQQLVLDQILQLTGRRSLGGDPLSQYRTLMDGAAAEAARLGLPLGAPLTSDQIASLSQDIVWLVEQEVNGQKVLVPVVYLSKATAERLAADGALIDGDTLDVRSTGTIRNDGTLSGSNGTWLSADQLINDGAIKSSGGQVGITTQRDTVNRGVLAGHSVVIDAGGDVVNTVKFAGINATAGKIQAGAGGLSITAARDVINQGVIASDGVAMVKAGRDFVQDAAVTSTAAAAGVRAAAGSLTAGTSAVVSTGRDAVLDQSTVSAGQHVVIDAGRDANFIASAVQAGGSIAVTADRDINSTTVTDTTTYRHTDTVKEGKKKTTTTTTLIDETVRGSTFTANGDMAFVSERGNIDMVAANVRSENGAVGLLAKNGDVTLRNAHETDSQIIDSASKKKNTLSTTKTTSHFESHDTQSVGTTVSGETVAIGGNNISITGSDVVSDKGTTLMAKNNVTIEAGTNTHTESSSSSKTKSGVFSDGGTGFVIGKNKQGQTTDLREVTHTGSVVGSVDGRVDIYAGGHYQQTGSDVIGMQGVGISGSTVTIQHAEDTLEVNQTQKTSSAGIHVSVKGGAADAANAAYQSAKRAGEVEDDRLSALYVAKGAQALYAGGSNPLGNIGGQVDQAVSDAKNKGQTAGGMSLRVGIGGSSSKAETEYRETTAHGSTVYSGNGDATVIARDGDLNVIGSKIEGINTTVAALNGNLNLRSAEQTTSLREKNSAKSGEVGFTAGSEAGLGVYVSASGAKGKGTGDSTSYAETVIGGNRGTTTFISGGSTTLEGAQVIGERVIGQVGGDFTVISQQDTDTYKRNDRSAGIDVAVGTGGGSVSANYAQSKIDSNYTSVREQSGIQAGAGGFQIDVKGHTQLDGGAIASTADPAKNTFSTGSLGFTDLKNEAEYKATSVSVSVSGGSNGGSGNGGYANTGDKVSSTTKAGIADGTLVVKDGSGAGIEHGTIGLQQDGLKEIYDAQKVAETLEIQQVAGQVTFTAVGDYAKSKTRDYENAERDKAIADQKLKAGGLSEQEAQYWLQVSNQNGDVMAANQAQYDAWKDGSTNKAFAHAVAGALTAGLGGGNALDGALGAAASELARPLTDDESKLVKMLVSAGIGGAVGGEGVAGITLSGEVNNRMLHSRATNGLPEVEQIQALAGGDPQREMELWAAACALAKCSAGIPTDDPNYQYWTGLEQLGNSPARQEDRDRLGSAVSGTNHSYSGTQWTDSQWLFGYDQKDAINDWNTRTRAGEYAGRTIQTVGGGIGVITGGMSCIPTYGAGCALATAGLDQMQAGIRGASTFGATGLQVLFPGMSEGAAELAYGLLTGAGELASARTAIAATATKADEITQAAFRGAQGVYGADGIPLMNYSQLTNSQKMVVAEILGEQKIQNLVPDGTFIGRSQGVGETGIDNILQVNRPDVDYVIVEYKFGTSKLGNTADGVQGSDAWTLGSGRLEKSVGDRVVADGIEDAVKKGRVERWVVNTDPAGHVTVGLLDKNGKFIPQPTSRLFGRTKR